MTMLMSGGYIIEIHEMMPAIEEGKGTSKANISSTVYLKIVRW